MIQDSQYIDMDDRPAAVLCCRERGVVQPMDGAGNIESSHEYELRFGPGNTMNGTYDIVTVKSSDRHKTFLAIPKLNADWLLIKQYSYYEDMLHEYEFRKKRLGDSISQLTLCIGRLSGNDHFNMIISRYIQGISLTDMLRDHQELLLQEIYAMLYSAVSSMKSFKDNNVIVNINPYHVIISPSGIINVVDYCGQALFMDNDNVLKHHYKEWLWSFFGQININGQDGRLLLLTLMDRDFEDIDIDGVKRQLALFNQI